MTRKKAKTDPVFLAASLRRPLGGSDEPINFPDEVVAAVIAFANDEIQPAWQTRCHDPAADRKAARIAAKTAIEAERSFAIEMLECAAQGLMPLGRKLLERTEEELHGFPVHMYPYARFDRDGRVSVFWHLHGDATDSGPWVRFAGIELARRARGDQTDIGRCHLETCGRYFLIDWSEKNRPRTQYCCPEHRIEHHKRRAAVRKRKSRAGQRTRESR